MFNHKLEIEMKKNSLRKALGFLAGAATGAIAGILLAPNSGKKTRENIATKASQKKDDFNASVKKGVDKFNSFKDSVFSLVTKQEEEIGQENGQQ
jgi:gas vesicle protein